MYLLPENEDGWYGRLIPVVLAPRPPSCLSLSFSLFSTPSLCICEGEKHGSTRTSCEHRSPNYCCSRLQQYFSAPFVDGCTYLWPHQCFYCWGRSYAPALPTSSSRLSRFFLQVPVTAVELFLLLLFWDKEATFNT